MTGPESLIVPSRSSRTAVGCSDVVAGAVGVGEGAFGVNRLPVLGSGGLPPGSHVGVVGYCDVDNVIRRQPVAGEPRPARAPKEQVLPQSLRHPYRHDQAPLESSAHALTDGAGEPRSRNLSGHVTERAGPV